MHDSLQNLRYLYAQRGIIFTYSRVHNFYASVTCTFASLLHRVSYAFSLPNELLYYMLKHNLAVKNAKASFMHLELRGSWTTPYSSATHATVHLRMWTVGVLLGSMIVKARTYTIRHPNASFGLFGWKAYR